jgi:two-component system, sensor histidine kinase
VELLDGNIEFESEYNKGTVFYFDIRCEIPTDITPSDSIEADAILINQEQQSQTIRILLAEDDRINQMYLKRFLEDQGWVVTAAYNGEQAIEKFKAAEFDIILMDGQMPKMDGFEATKKIREINTEIPVLAITGYAVKGDKERFLEAGMNGYISKPINENELIKEIIRVTEKHRIVN